MLYHAFVSYSHAADGKLAPAIQHALHTIAKPWYKLRALRVFRDKTTLSATPGLWPAIEAALSESEWFLYLASPQAAQSQWVQPGDHVVADESIVQQDADPAHRRRSRVGRSRS
jgi:MTH538 TIR-like domain (DUF1863)